MFLAHPLFGVGVGNYDQFAPFYFPQGTDYQKGQAAHNIIVGALAETGIVGTILLLAMVGTIVFEGYRMVRAHQDSCSEIISLPGVRTVSGSQSVAAGIVIGYLVFLTTALSDDLQQDRYFLALAGLVHGAYKASARADSHHE